MKKQIITFLLVLNLGLLSWGSAQGARTDLFDVKKSQQELQIMKGILSTTLGFVANELRSHEVGSKSQNEGRLAEFYDEHWSGSGISAYYLYGQGATFVIPISSLRMAYSKIGRGFARLGDLDNSNIDVRVDLGDEMERASTELEAATMALEAERDSIAAVAEEAAEQAEQAAEYRVEAAKASAKAAGRGTGTAPGQTAMAPQASPSPRPVVAPVHKAALNQEEMRKKLAEAQEKVKKRREALEARRQKLLQSLTEVKAYLIEALANHADSLTTVKPNEYVNIIFTTDEGFPVFGQEDGSRAGRQVVSVQKSWITDYKAGRLTLEAFKQKAMQYNT